LFFEIARFLKFLEITRGQSAPNPSVTDCDSLSVVVRRLWRAMPLDSLSGARRALVGARDRLVKHGLLVDRLRLEGPSAALDLGLAQLRVFERDHIVAEAVFLAVRARLRL
jgi:hypothetical protein